MFRRRYFGAVAILVALTLAGCSSTKNTSSSATSSKVSSSTQAPTTLVIQSKAATEFHSAISTYEANTASATKGVTGDTPAEANALAAADGALATRLKSLTFPASAQKDAATLIADLQILDSEVQKYGAALQSGSSSASTIGKMMITQNSTVLSDITTLAHDFEG